MKEDFINFYNAIGFDKLIFQYQIVGENTNPYIYLVFYAMDKEGQPMHNKPINLIFTPSDDIIHIKGKFIIGNIELSYDFITKRLGADFQYFIFEAERSEACPGYIDFDVSTNSSLITGSTPVNPCPPNCIIHPQYPSIST